MPVRTTTPKPDWWNIPNQLTAVRLVLAMVVFGLIEWHLYLGALIVFSIAVSTDWIDGYWARKYGQVTQLGRIFDPFVDKFIICGIFTYLASVPDSAISAWMAVIVISRELLVTALRGMVEGKGGDFSARWSGKWKMVFQCAAAALDLLVLAMAGWSAAWKPWSDGLGWVRLVAIVLAIATTIYSGLVYVAVAIEVLRAPPPRQA